MSDDRLEFQLALVDKMSGPAQNAAASMNQLNQILIQLNQTNNTFNSSMQGSTAGMATWTTGMGSAMAMAGRFKDTILDVARAVASMTRSFVESVIEQAKFHTRSMTTLNALLRNEPGGARREFSAGIRLAQGLPGTTEDVIKQRVGLVSAGYNDRGQRDRMTALLQDMLALAPDADAGTQDLALRAFAQIKGERFLSSRRLGQITNLNTGIGRAEIFGELARGRGLRGNNDQNYAQIQAMISQRQITSEEFTAAMERADVAKTGKSLGGFAHEQGSGFLGQLSNFQETPQRLMQQLFARQENIMSSGGLSAFSGFITKVNEFFKEGTTSGERVLGILDKLVNDVFGTLFGNDPTPILTTIVDVFEKWEPRIISVIGLFPMFVGWVAQALPYLDRVFDIVARLWPLFQLFGEILGVVATYWASFASIFLSTIEAITQSQGFNIIMGMVRGIVSAIPHVQNAMETVGNEVEGSLARRLNMHSPSLVMQEMGGHIGEGLALGVEASKSRVDLAASSLSSAFTANRSIADFNPGSSSGAGSGHGPVALTVNFHVPNAASSAEEIAEATRPMFESALAEMLERMAVGAGVG